MVENSKCREAAIRELVHPTLEMTKSFLTSDDVERVSGVPQIIYADESDEEYKEYYFSAKDDYYFIIISILVSELPQPCDFRFGEYFSFGLIIHSYDDDLGGICDKLEFNRDFVKFKKTHPKAFLDQNIRRYRLIYEPKLESKYNGFSAQLDEILSKFVPIKNKLITLYKDSNKEIEISVGVVQHISQMGYFYLTVEDMSKLNELRIDISFSIMAGGYPID